jgi:hypothetical protein
MLQIAIPPAAHSFIKFQPARQEAVLILSALAEEIGRSLTTAQAACERNRPTKGHADE